MRSDTFEFFICFDFCEMVSNEIIENIFAVIVHEPAVLIEGVLFRARYLGSTQLICEGRPTKTSRMMQAQEAVARVKVVIFVA